MFWKRCRKVNKLISLLFVMVKKKVKFGLGKWGFLVGVVLAIVFAFIGKMSPEVVSVLAVIGIAVGLLNVREEEARAFLMSGAVLIIASAFGQGAFGLLGILDRVLEGLLVIFVPATIVVAIRNVFGIATS